MNSAGKAAALILLTAFVAGCRHRTRATPPQAAQAPIAPVSMLAAETPPPQLPPPELPQINPPGPTTTRSKPKPRRTVHRKLRHTTETIPADDTAAKDQAASSANEQAANDISPIGQLSAAGESTNTPRRHEILDEINSTEKGLNAITRPLSKDEQVTAAQIRTFLAKAKDALNQEDLDGAHTLVTKAEVLLNELKKE